MTMELTCSIYRCRVSRRPAAAVLVSHAAEPRGAALARRCRRIAASAARWLQGLLAPVLCKLVRPGDLRIRARHFASTFRLKCMVPRCCSASGKCEYIERRWWAGELLSRSWLAALLLARFPRSAMKVCCRQRRANSTSGSTAYCGSKLLLRVLRPACPSGPGQDRIVETWSSHVSQTPCACMISRQACARRRCCRNGSTCRPCRAAIERTSQPRLPPSPARPRSRRQPRLRWNWRKQTTQFWKASTSKPTPSTATILCAWITRASFWQDSSIAQVISRKPGLRARERAMRARWRLRWFSCGSNAVALFT